MKKKIFLMIFYLYYQEPTIYYITFFPLEMSCCCGTVINTGKMHYFKGRLRGPSCTIVKKNCLFACSGENRSGGGGCSTHPYSKHMKPFLLPWFGYLHNCVLNLDSMLPPTEHFGFRLK